MYVLMQTQRLLEHLRRQQLLHAALKPILGLKVTQGILQSEVDQKRIQIQAHILQLLMQKDQKK